MGMSHVHASLAVVLLLASAFCQGAAGESIAAMSGSDLTLRYDKPAQNWEKEALPIGNGRMGAMLFGGLALDRIQFNEISLWTGNEDVMVRTRPSAI